VSWSLRSRPLEILVANCDLSMPLTYHASISCQASVVLRFNTIKVERCHVALTHVRYQTGDENHAYGVWYDLCMR
jgi:hypothetical protein